MEDPTTKPSGSNPAPPRSTDSDTDRGEGKPPDGSAPPVFASRESAAGGSQDAVVWPGCWLENNGMTAPCIGCRQSYCPACPSAGRDTWLTATSTSARCRPPS